MVSVIIPTYGGGEGLKKVIESVRNQSYKQIEIIVVDDNGCGTENQIKTAAVLKEYTDAGLVQYITPEKNAGGSAARNRGAYASKGEYLMFLDDDDTISEDKIEKQVEALEQTPGKYGLSYCSTKVWMGDKLSNTIFAQKSGDILYPYMMGKVYMGTGTVLMLRDVWIKLGGYDESFIRHQDWEFFARILNEYDAIAVRDVYFNRYITNRNLPKKLNTLEMHMDHYLSFLKKYDFRLSKNQMRNVINMNNSRIALRCLKEKNIKKFINTLNKYDNFVVACIAFLFFLLNVCKDKMIGKRS